MLNTDDEVQIARPSVTADLVVYLVYEILLYEMYDVSCKKESI